MILRTLVGPVLCLALATQLVAEQVPRSSTLQPLWDQLDAARGYRDGFVERTGDSRDRIQGGLAFDDLRENYLRIDLPGLGGQTPRDAFLELIGRDGNGQPVAMPGGFAEFLDGVGLVVGGSIQEAVQGYQEALGEYVAGEILLANDTLLQGLRTRFPRQGDLGDESQLELLERSTDEFLTALRVAGDEARTNPRFLRASGIVNFDFPFFVENTPPGSGPGELVEAEYFRIINLVNRYGIARNALAKRKFFFGNDDPAARVEAAEEFKRGAQSIYLASALLAANQSVADFQNNNGGELDRQITIAQQFFDDIQNGFNPLTLLGDFVPAQSTDGLFDLLETQLQSAVCSEIGATDAARAYDEDQTALVQELRDQTEDYIDQIDILLGLVPPFTGPGDQCAPPQDLLCDPALPADRDAILALADDTAGQNSVDYLRGCDATICNNYRSWEASKIEFEAAEQAQQAIVDQMQIEEERANTVTRIIRSGAIGVSLLEVAQGLAKSITPDIEIDPSNFGVPSISFAPSEAVGAIFDAQITNLEALTEIQLEQTESSAVLRNLFLELTAQEINKRRAALAVVEARADYTASIGDLKRFLRNYAASREELTQAYYTNPAYQIALDRAAQNAERSFEAAMITAYKATKALEYEWSERLLNPVLDPNGVDRPIGDTGQYDDITSAETAFAVRAAGGSASAPTPNLVTYVQSLQAWDATMREIRGPLRQEGQSRTVLLKRDVLGFDSPDEAFNRIAFRSHIASRRVPGLNPEKPDLILDFPLQILDQRIFPAVPNLKIQDLRLDLRSVPGRELLVPPSPNPPLVSVIHEDQALLRTFFADYPNDDDFLEIDLEGTRSFRQSQFFAQAESTIDGGGSATPNTQLARRSPAVSRWILRFEMDNGVNRDLVLENLDDIWVRITYAFGLPVEFDFPDILTCPN